MKYDYYLVSFVCVRTEDEKYPLLFCVDRVVGVHLDLRQLFHEIRVYWYEFYNGTDYYTGNLRSIFLHKGKGCEEWVYRISVDCVLVSFNVLTSENTLHALVARYVREETYEPSMFDQKLMFRYILAL